MHTRLKTKFAVILLSFTISACGTVEPPKTASSCLIFSLITYANAKPGEEKKDDPGNQLDTSETVTQVQAHNAAYRATCP